MLEALGAADVYTRCGHGDGVVGTVHHFDVVSGVLRVVVVPEGETLKSVERRRRRRPLTTRLRNPQLDPDVALVREDVDDEGRVLVLEIHPHPQEATA